MKKIIKKMYKKVYSKKYLEYKKKMRPFSPYNINYGHALVNNNYILLIPDIRYSHDVLRTR